MYDTTSSMPAWMLGKVRGGMSVLEVRPPMMCPSPMRLDIVQACGATDLTVSPNGRQGLLSCEVKRLGNQQGCKSARAQENTREHHQRIPENARESKRTQENARAKGKITRSK